MGALAVGGLLVVVLLLVIAAAHDEPPKDVRRQEAERRLRRKPLGNVTVLRAPQDDDPLIGCCARCGRWWSQHPGGFCPDGIDAGGLVAVNGPVFQPLDEAEDGR